MDQVRLDKCRARLLDAAKARQRVTYSELATHLGVANQGVGPYLNAIYEAEQTAGRPDLSLVAVYADTGYGRYNSRGGVTQSIKVDPANPEDVAAYDRDLARVYDHWASPDRVSG